MSSRHVTPGAPGESPDRVPSSRPLQDIQDVKSEEHDKIVRLQEELTVTKERLRLSDEEARDVHLQLEQSKHTLCKVETHVMSLEYESNICQATLREAQDAWHASEALRVALSRPPPACLVTPPLVSHLIVSPRRVPLRVALSRPPSLVVSSPHPGESPDRVPSSRPLTRCLVTSPSRPLAHCHVTSPLACHLVSSPLVSHLIASPRRVPLRIPCQVPSHPL